jgi:hypothetical protein
MEEGALPSSISLAAAAAAAAPSYPPHFTVLDPHAEALILASLQSAPPVFGSKKRRREATRCSRPCHSFAATGTCTYGDACRFAHGEAASQAPAEEGRDVMRALAQRRERLFAAGGGGGGEGGGGDGSSGGGGAPLPPPPPPPVGLDRMVGPQVTPLSVVARYYTRMFAPGVGGVAPPGWDTYVYLQANCVAVVGLAPSHALLAHPSPLAALAFTPPPALVPGKSPWVEADTVVAVATTEDGRQWPLRAGLRGTLTELNSRLEANPALLKSHAATRGHLAVLTLAAKRVPDATRVLLGEEDFHALCRARGLPY